MAILVNQDTRVVVQGITGGEGKESTRRMIAYGTNVVGGVTPGKGGEWVEGRPVFDTVKAAIYATDANTSLIYVPAQYAPDSIYEAVDSGIKLIVCITEGIPLSDMTRVYEYVRRGGSRLIGPNCPGLLSPGLSNVGIIPGDFGIPGDVAVISRSGTLMYEMMQILRLAGIGQSTCVGIGGDPIIGSTYVDLLELFENDPETEAVVLIGEIGGNDELLAAEYVQSAMTKLVVGYLVGKYAPEGVRMGHPGAIVEIREDTYAEKLAALQSAGVRVAAVPEDIPHLLRS